MASLLCMATVPSQANPCSDCAEQRKKIIRNMRSDEAVLIKCYGSAEDGTARFTAHSAFEDPTTPADVLPRESIEVRTLVLHDV